jgi:hypothetical protein
VPPRILNNKIQYLKAEFEAGRIKTFDQVFAFYAMSTLARDLGLHLATFKKKVKSPRLFKIDEMIVFGELIDVDYHIILQFLTDMIDQNKHKKGKNG